MVVPRLNTWWRHQAETFSAICAGHSPVPGEFPTQRPVMQNFDIFFDLRLNERLSKQSWGWWLEMPSRPLWRHNYEYMMYSALMAKIKHQSDASVNWISIGSSNGLLPMRHQVCAVKFESKYKISSQEGAMENVVWEIAATLFRRVGGGGGAWVKLTSIPSLYLHAMGVLWDHLGCGGITVGRQSLWHPWWIQTANKISSTIRPTTDYILIITYQRQFLKGRIYCPKLAVSCHVMLWYTHTKPTSMISSFTMRYFPIIVNHILHITQYNIFHTFIILKVNIEGPWFNSYIPDNIVFIGTRSQLTFTHRIKMGISF